MSKRTPRQSAKPATLETQAKKILRNPDKYDVDTRHAIALCLSNLAFRRSETELRESVKEAENELRELIRKANAGEPVFDVACIGKEYVNAARIIYEAITEANYIPQFIYDAITVALTEAERKLGCKVWIAPHGSEDDAVEGAYSIERLARLFKYNPLLKIEVEPKKELAEMIVAVIEHPDCPQEIRDGINGATSDIFNNLNEGERKVYFTAPYIHALIVESKAQEGAQA
ncbi:MAG: hypothetical protein WBP93_18390 [Pyrinomonadaceae bacterium]